MLRGRVLPPLWSIPTQIGISLGVVWLKGAFRVCTDPFKTPHDKISAKYRKDRQYIVNIFKIFTMALTS